MFKNYLKTAFVNLWREKNKTALNVVGLAIGVAGSLVLFLLIRYHNSFNLSHSKRDRIYRVVTISDGNNGRDYTSGIPSVFPEAFKNEFHEAEEVTFTSYRSGALISIQRTSGEPMRYEEVRGVTFAQSNFFKIFDRKIISGDANNALAGANEATISKSLALKYFGTETALGAVVEYDKRQYKIVAIMDDDFSNTDLPFTLMLSCITLKKEFDERGWRGIFSDDQCYIALKKGVQSSTIERRMPAFEKKYLGDNRDKKSFVLQPLSAIHFDDRFGNYNYSTVSHSMLSALGMIAFFLVITACINFINLSTADAIKRSKEVGIRKSLGSSRMQLILQFQGEATIITLFSVALAIVLVEASLGFVNSFLQLRLLFSVTDPMVMLFIAGIILGVSLLSGLYPSVVVSAYQPALALKNKIGNRDSSGYSLRRGLVVMQFVISQMLIIGTIVLITQIKYFHDKDLGFREEAIITVPIPIREEAILLDSSKTSLMRTLHKEVLRLKGVEYASLNNTAPSSGNIAGTRFTIEGNEVLYEAQVKTVDSSYLQLFGLELVAGQNIGDVDTARGFMVNEKLASTVGYINPHELIGKSITMGGKMLPVVGVVKDFHTVSLRSPIEATIMLNRIRSYRSLAIKISPADMQKTIKEIQKKWEPLYPDFIFSYQFLDESIRQFYASEERTSILLAIFTSLAIFIGCLGLFGLASFMANQKTKEIGVRKVMGASVNSIVLRFYKEFVILIIVGFVLAAPVAWYFSNQWLSQFAYKIDVGPLTFIVGLLLTMFTTLFTVGYRSFKAATANPIDSLKYE